MFKDSDQIAKIAIYCATTFLVVLFLSFVGCSMHSNSLDGERNKTEAIKIEAQAKLEEAQSQTELKKIESIKELINKGVNPLAARCAVEGYKDIGDAAICERASQDK